MPARENRAIIFPHRQVGLKPVNSGGGYNTIFGVQEVGSNLNFNLETIFEMGQSAIYFTQEDLPDVEFSISKVLDGSPLVWHEATRSATAGPSLLNRSTERTVLAIGIFPDTNDASTGTPPSIVESSGLVVSSMSYEFNVDGPFTESVTLVGNDQIYKADPKILNPADQARSNSLSFPGNAAFSSNADVPASGVLFRKNILFAANTALGVDVNGMVADPDATIIPPEVDGISDSGTNEETNGIYNASIQSISVSTDLNRENINELGRRGPYFRRPSFPVDVTCAITINAKSGSMISATENGIYSTSDSVCGTNSNTRDRTIRIATCFGERFYLGTKNRLSSVDEGGGGVDGSNVTTTYNFLTRNELTVMAEYDPNPNAATWWTNRADYLVDT